MSRAEEDKYPSPLLQAKREHADSVDEKSLQESGELAALTANVKNKLKNGCCKDCMKAFSKNGKVIAA